MERLIWSGHLTNPKSGESGLLALAREAYDLYQVEVINHGKIYQRFADDFIYSHEFHDAVDAWSKNEHQKNYRIIDSLLTNRRDLVETFFRENHVGDEELKEMLRLFDTTLPSHRKSIGHRIIREESDIQFCSCVDSDDLEILVKCCNDAKVFHEVIVADDLRSLLDGTLELPLHSSNNRLVAFFFDQLAAPVGRNSVSSIGQNQSLTSLLY